jgi:hypothetical protein
MGNPLPGESRADRWPGRAGAKKYWIERFAFWAALWHSAAATCTGLEPPAMPSSSSSRNPDRKNHRGDRGYGKREGQWRFAAFIVSALSLGATLWLVLTHLHY